MKKHLFKISLCAMVLGFAATQLSAQTISFQSQDVECLGVELDGSQTVRAFGKGRNKSDAVEQAKKNAVYAVIFTGIRGGVQGCDMRPLVNEPNARDKYEEYFNIFFLDDGAYKEYVSMEDAKRRSKDKTTNKYVKNYTVTVRVLRAELKARLRADGILP